MHRKPQKLTIAEISTIKDLCFQDPVWQSFFLKNRQIVQTTTSHSTLKVVWKTITSETNSVCFLSLTSKVEQSVNRSLTPIQSKYWQKSQDKANNSHSYDFATNNNHCDLLPQLRLPLKILHLFDVLILILLENDIGFSPMF